MSLLNDYQDNSVVVPVFTGINDTPRVPTSTRAGNGSDIIARYNQLLSFLDTDLVAVEGRVTVIEGEQTTQNNSLSSLSTTQSAQQSEIDDHETRISALESPGGGTFSQSIVLNAPTSTNLNAWFFSTPSNVTLFIVHVPFGNSWGNAGSNLTEDLGNIEQHALGGVVSINNLESASGTLPLSSVYQGAGIYLIYITAQQPAGYGSAQEFPNTGNNDLEIQIDQANSSGNFAVGRTNKSYPESNINNSPWNGNKQYLLIYDDNFDITFDIINPAA